ncbi:SH3 and cysteine-rich domain-containing protein 2-like [Salvelinus sp. IW2-2015]|uniref:SH3 and cysteine-rich domain-containing protein 2-like n=1 Tax=Salvelinus sp. IW2-2015 TaxID=2691554 RepID=UPI0038D41C29
MGAHLWCTSELSQQPCNGKSGVAAFKRNFSSPMLVNEQLAVVKEVQPTQGAGRGRGVDPIYAALRYGTSLAQMSRSSFGSVSESPTHSQGEGGEGGEEGAEQYSMRGEATGDRGLSDPFPCLSDLLQCETRRLNQMMGQRAAPGACRGNPAVKVPKRIEFTRSTPVHRRVTVLEFWMMVIVAANDRALLHMLRRVAQGKEWRQGGLLPLLTSSRGAPGEGVRVTQPVPASRGMGHMPVKEDQICVGKSEDSEGFLKLSSGKKRGLVPAKSIEEI